MEKLSTEELKELGKKKNQEKRAAIRLIKELEREMVKKAKSGKDSAMIKRSIGTWDEGNKEQKKNVKEWNEEQKKYLELAYEMLQKKYQDENIDFTFQEKTLTEKQIKDVFKNNYRKVDKDYWILKAEW